MVVPHDVGAASGIAVGAETVWIPDALGGGLTVLRRPDGAFRKLIGDAGSGESVWVDDRAAWSTDEVGGAIVGIDPETLQVTARISVLSGPADLAIADGVAWVTDRYDRWLTRVPLDGGPQRRIPVQARLSSVVIDGNDVWATSETGDALVRIDRVTVSVRETIPLADGPDALLVTPDGLWVALRESRAVVRLDRALAEVGRYDLAGIPSDLALLDGVVWVTIEAP